MIASKNNGIMSSSLNFVYPLSVPLKRKVRKTRALPVPVAGMGTAVTGIKNVLSLMFNFILGFS